jgi:hypothetical protein
LKSLGDKPIRASQALILNSRSFSTEAEAIAAGRAAKAALLYVAAKLRMPLDIGKDQPSASFARSIRDQFRRDLDAELRADIHGVTIYDDTIETVFASVAASATLGKHGQTFVRELADALQKDLAFSENEMLAFELYALVQFESSARARFLTLVSIVETLAENVDRPPKGSYPH